METSLRRLFISAGLSNIEAAHVTSLIAKCLGQMRVIFLNANLEGVSMSSDYKGSGILQIFEIFNDKFLIAFFRFNNLYVMPLCIWPFFALKLLSSQSRMFKFVVLETLDIVLFHFLISFLKGIFNVVSWTICLFNFILENVLRVRIFSGHLLVSSFDI